MRALVILLLVVLAYASLPRNGWTYEEPNLVGASAGPIPWQSRPLTRLSFRLDRMAFDTHPTGWHLTNLGIHLVNGALVAVLASALGLSGWLTAGIFLLHPLQTQAVAYLNGRSELLVLCGILVTLCALLRPDHRGSLPATVLGVLWAWASKESSLVLVGLVPLVLWAMSPHRRRTWGILTLALLPALVLIPFAVRLGRSAHVDSLDWASVQATASWVYVGLSVMPVGLGMEHDFSQVPRILQPLMLVGYLAVPAQAWVWRQTHREVAVSILWIWIACLPRLLLPIPNDAYFAEHQFYTPMVGVSLLMASLWREWTLV